MPWLIGLAVLGTLGFVAYKASGSKGSVGPVVSSLTAGQWYRVTVYLPATAGAAPMTPAASQQVANTLTTELRAQGMTGDIACVVSQGSNGAYSALVTGKFAGGPSFFSNTPKGAVIMQVNVVYPPS